MFSVITIGIISRHFIFLQSNAFDSHKWQVTLFINTSRKMPNVFSQIRLYAVFCFAT